MSGPKLFISYSWSSPDHEQWVLQFATQLREAGVDAILDKWDLREGQDADAFMERMVSDPTVQKVVMICDRVYVEKANKRAGGVGTEAQIISRKIYEATDQRKFVAVVVERHEDGKAYLPSYYSSRIYVDLSDNNLYNKNFEQLIRWIFDKPLYEKPEVGPEPAYLRAEQIPSLGTSAALRRAINGMRNGERYASGAIAEYFDLFSNNMEKFRIRRADGDDREFDELVIDNINLFRSYRDEVVELISALTKFASEADANEQLHKFFEKLIPYTERPSGVTSWRNMDFDNYKFIVGELFIYAIATHLKSGNFRGAAHLLDHLYFYDSDLSDDNMHSYLVFNLHLESLRYRNDRLKLNRVSLHADILKERANVLGLSFVDIMEADFLLYLRNCLDANRRDGQNYWRWWPMTLVYAGYRTKPFEIFARAQETAFFDRFKVVLGIKDKAGLVPLVEGFTSGKVQVPNFGGWVGPINPIVLMNYAVLATH